MPRVLIHCTASILLSVIQFRKCHHVQIIETASILHLQWAMTSMCTLLTTFDWDTTTVLVQLSQAESVNYSYSELSYVSAKLILLLFAIVYRYMVRFVEVTGS